MHIAMLSLVVTKSLFLAFYLQGTTAQPFGCSNRADMQRQNLVVAMGPNVNIDYCNNMPATQTVTSLLGTCSEFCGQQNIPILVGIPEVGFAQAQLETVCLPNGADDAFLKYDATLMSNCQTWASALDSVKLSSSVFVAALQNITYAQLQFRTGIKQRIVQLTQQVASPQFRKKMQAALYPDILDVYLETLNANFQDFTHDGSLSKMMQSTAANLKAAGAGLQAALIRNMPLIQNFVGQCGQALVGVGRAREFLLDICVQQGAACLDKNQARHVGCCCGVVPLAGSFSIPGKKASNRRLTQSEMPDPTDVCAEAAMLAQPSVSARTKDLQSSAEGQQELQNLQTTLAATFPAYYQATSRCTRRLQGLDPVLPVAAPHGLASPSEGPNPRRRTTELVGCNPPRSEVQPDLKVSFWQNTEEFLCGELPPPVGKVKMDVEGLSGFCESFCGPDALPLLMGSPTFGFNLSSMDRVCLGKDINGGLFNGDLNLVQQCHIDADAFADVFAKTSNFNAKLLVLEAEKLHFQAKVRNITGIMAATLSQQASRLIVRTTEAQRITVLKQLLKDLSDELTQATGGSAKLAVVTAMSDVNRAGSDLLISLANSMESMTRFLSNCNQFFIGTGSKKEYLLDLCSQSSTECLESSQSSHAGCCCGYNPFLKLGQTYISDSTISGIEGAGLRGDAARVANRRVQSRAAADAVDICAASWTESRPGVNSAYDKINALGQSQVLSQAEQALATKYPNYCASKSRLQAVSATTFNILTFPSAFFIFFLIF